MIRLIRIIIFGFGKCMDGGPKMRCIFMANRRKRTMSLRGLPLTLFTLIGLSIVLGFGCCGTIPSPNGLNISGPGVLDIQKPVVNLNLDNSSGMAPFYPQYTYTCYDPGGKLVSCELRIDGKTFAQGPNQSSLFGSDYEYPEFFKQLITVPGVHDLEIFAVNGAGESSSKTIQFIVLPSTDLTKPGWYTCNGENASPCNLYQKAYCDKFTPTDLSVRTAASTAISKHPGEFSVNQLLDIYDWVYGNVIYQNVPVDLTYQPYSPAETLATKSGDCKNQAVLIASMVESIGGTARVLIVPDCVHAFAEVYVGNKSELDLVTKAIYAHYGSKAPSINWHYENNGTENWLIFDTAGGSYPGNTIKECLNVNQTFVMYNCGIGTDKALNAPAVTQLEYGPFDLYNKDTVIDPGHWQYFTYSQTDPDYSFCRYNLNVKSLSAMPLSWYVIPEGSYQSFKAGNSFQYYERQENVLGGSYTIDWSDAKNGFTYIIYNTDQDRPNTVQITVNSTCFGS